MKSIEALKIALMGVKKHIDNELKTNTNNMEQYVQEQLNITLDNVILKKVTQAEYDALAIKDPNTLYIIIQ